MIICISCVYFVEVGVDCFIRACHFPQGIVFVQFCTKEETFV